MAPRDGSSIYHVPVGTDAVTDTTIDSTKYNLNVHDVETDLNTPRPIVAGGTGASSADSALDNLSAEKFKQAVTNWDTTVWRAGSYYAATTATGTAPVAGHAFAGIAYYANATDLVLEATDLTDPINPTKYIRIMASGVWGNWLLASGGSGTTGDYTFDSTLTFPPASGQIRFNNATENSTTEIFISHLNALGVDNTGTLSASLKSGYDIFIQDKDEPTKYKIFTANAAPVITGGDFRITVGLKTAGVDIVSGQRVLTAISTGSAVVYDIAQGLTTNQQAQARANIGVVKKNYIINGAMMISQENGTTPLSALGQYPADQFQLAGLGGAGSLFFGQVGLAQAAATSPSGSPNRIRFTVNTFDATTGPTETYMIEHRIEGSRCTELKSGLSTAKTVVLQFGVKAPAGTYCVAFRNHSATPTRSYVAEYVIAAGEANIDVIKNITFQLDTTGTWNVDNSSAYSLTWALQVGSTYQTAPGIWTAGNFLASANQFNFMATPSAVFELFDVGLYEGTVAPPFVVPDYISELQACQRYFEMVGHGLGGNIQSATTLNLQIRFAVQKRAAPTVTQTTATPGILWSGAYATGSGSASSFNGGPDTFGCLMSVSGFTGLTVGQGFGSNTANWFKVNARL